MELTIYEGQMMMLLFGEQGEVESLKELVRTTGPMGAAVVLLVLAIWAVSKYAVLPVLKEVKPISDNLAETARNNVAASTSFKSAAEASEKAAAAWEQVGQAAHAKA